MVWAPQRVAGGALLTPNHQGAAKTQASGTHQLFPGSEAGGLGVRWVSPVGAGEAFWRKQPGWGKGCLEPLPQTPGYPDVVALDLPLSQATLLFPQPCRHHQLCQHLLTE